MKILKSINLVQATCKCRYSWGILCKHMSTCTYFHICIALKCMDAPQVTDLQVLLGQILISKTHKALEMSPNMILYRDSGAARGFLEPECGCAFPRLLPVAP